MFTKVESTWEVWTCENNHLVWDMLREYKFCPSCDGKLANRKKTGEITICDNCKKEINTVGVLPAYCPYCGEKGEMEKIEKCPNCERRNPQLTLELENRQLYIDGVPDTRTYWLVCVDCGYHFHKYEIDNTRKAVKSLRDKMDKLYGPSYILPRI
jgi:NADH pyrophosphatase NudC (nudix superfamily)